MLLHSFVKQAEDASASQDSEQDAKKIQIQRILAR